MDFYLHCPEIHLWYGIIALLLNPYSCVTYHASQQSNSCSDFSSSWPYQSIAKSLLRSSKWNARIWAVNPLLNDKNYHSRVRSMKNVMWRVRFDSLMEVCWSHRFNLSYEAWELCNNLDHVWILNPVNLPLHTNLASKSWTDLNSLMQIAFTFQIFSEIYAIGSKITFLLVIISLKFISGSSVVNGQVTGKTYNITNMSFSKILWLLAAQLAFVITITVFWHLVKVHIR